MTDPSPAAQVRATVHLARPLHATTIPVQRPAQTVAVAGPQATPSRAVQLLRFGPGVPAVVPRAPATEAALASPAAGAKRHRQRLLNAALTSALAAVVVWMLWPAGPLRLRQIDVQANPAAVACGGAADVVATVHTNGRAGQLHYRWARSDGRSSGILEQTVGKGQGTVELHLRWAFTGPGSYDARATVQLINPAGRDASARLRYRC